jgi:hypothetical protein
MIGSSHQRQLGISTFIWILLFLAVAAGLSFDSYFVRELVSALLLFTLAFAVVAAFVTLFILMEEILERGVFMTALITHLIGSSVHDVGEEYGASTISHANDGSRIRNRADLQVLIPSSTSVHPRQSRAGTAVHEQTY